jgi:predicted metal-dependent phosphoesterase TrpH
MLIDLHCHSKYSFDNHLDPEALIRRAMEMGLDGVCFTEHHSMNASGPIRRIKAPRGFVILRGVEISTDLGHLLVYGVKDDAWNRWGRSNCLNLSKVVQSVHLLGGICVPAHPFRGWESLGERVYSLPDFDALETCNGANSSQLNDLAALAAIKLGLPSIGGSDCHSVEQVGRAFTLFGKKIRGMTDLIREIKAGNCEGRDG